MVKQLTVVAAATATALTVAVGNYVVTWLNETLSQADSEERVSGRMLDLVDLRDDGTDFQRWILGEFRSQQGVPTYTAANLALTRRRIHSLIREHRPTMRGCDLEKHTTQITYLAFVPDQELVSLSEVMSGGGWIHSLYHLLTGNPTVAGRISRMRSPDA